MRSFGAYAAIAAGLAYFVLMFFFYPFREVFEFGRDEGINLTKVLLLDRGYHLYSDVWSDQPPLLQYAIKSWLRVVGWDVNNARILQLAFASSIIFATHDILRLTRGHLAALTAILLLPCTQEFLKGSVAVMVGLPSIALALLAVWALIRWRLTSRSRWICVGGLLMGLSLATKLFTGFLVPILCLWILFIAARDRGAKLPALLPAAAWFLIALSTVSFILLWIVTPTHLSQLYEAHMLARHAVAKFGVAFLIGRLMHDWEIVVLAACGVLVLIRQRHSELLVIGLWFAGAISVLALHRPVWDHHLLLVTVPGCILSGVAIDDFLRGGVWGLVTGKERRLAAIVVGACTVVFGFRLLLGRQLPDKMRVMMDDNRRFTMEVAKAYNGQGDLMVTDQLMYAIRLRQELIPEIAILTTKRALTGLLTKERLLQRIFNESPNQIVLTSKLFQTVFNASLSDICRRYSLVYQEVLQPPFELYVRKDLMGDPLDALVSAAKKIPNAPSAHDAIGVQWARRSDSEQAMKHFGQALEIDPQHPSATCHLADTYMATGQYSRGFEVLEDGLRRTRHWKLRLIERCYAWRRATVPDPAHRNGTRAEEIARRSAERYTLPSSFDLATLAAALADQGRFDEARAEAEKALAQLSPCEENLRARLRAQLEHYRARRIFTEPVGMPVLIQSIPLVQFSERRDHSGRRDGVTESSPVSLESTPENHPHDAEDLRALTHASADEGRTIEVLQ